MYDDDVNDHRILCKLSPLFSTVSRSSGAVGSKQLSISRRDTTMGNCSGIFTCKSFFRTLMVLMLSWQQFFSILLANLVSTTFITLRNRQMQVHSSLNAETEDIHCLIDCSICSIEFYPEGRREIFRSCLRRYIKMIADELLSNQSPQRIRLNSGHPMLEFKKKSVVYM